MKFTREELLRLSVAERIELIGDLWDSLEGTGAGLPLSDAQKLELDRRLAEYDRDPTSARSWGEVREELERGE